MPVHHPCAQISRLPSSTNQYLLHFPHLPSQCLPPSPPPPPAKSVAFSSIIGGAYNNLFHHCTDPHICHLIAPRGVIRVLLGTLLRHRNTRMSLSLAFLNISPVDHRQFQRWVGWDMEWSGTKRKRKGGADPCRKWRSNCCIPHANTILHMDLHRILGVERGETQQGKQVFQYH